MFDILVVGEINPDLILTGDFTPEFGQVEKLAESASLTIGSSSAIFACGAARLGMKVALAGICGDDVFGHFMLEELKKRGVDTSYVAVRPGGSTGVSVILDRHSDRAILTYPGLMSALRSSDIPDEALRQARHLHVGSYFLQTGLQAGLASLFQRAHSIGLTTSLDTNYDPSGKWVGLEPLLPLTDVLLPNETEALALAHAPNVEAAAQALAGKVGLVVVKLGAAGALACRQGIITRASAIRVDVLDAVGAGDSFDAGFLFGFLDHWSVEKSLRLGGVCGALSMRKRGGTDGQPTLDEAMRYVPG